MTKRFESSENLVNLLESRGLQICDRNKAIQHLDNIGYYRLSAYMYPLLKMPKTAHLYKEGSTFKKVMMLYRFDKKLRLLMFNEIEKIEIAIRRAVMQITADMTGNPFWLTDSSYFLDSFKFNVTMLTQMYSRLILDISSWLFAYRVSNAQIKVEVEGLLLVYRAERGAVVEVVAHARLDVDAHIAEHVELHSEGCVDGQLPRLRSHVFGLVLLLLAAYHVLVCRLARHALLR